MRPFGCACKGQSFPQPNEPILTHLVAAKLPSGTSSEMDSVRYNRNMLIPKERLLDMPVMSLQTGIEIARTDSFIIDPRQLKIVAFYCKGPRLDVHPAILHVEDIRELSELGLIIDAADNIMSPQDLVRLGDVLKFHFTLENKMVVDDLGRKVGRITGFSIESRSFFVNKLHVRPGLLEAWKTAEVMIDRTQIIEINDETIIVKSPTIKAKHAVRPSRALVNGALGHPQAEAIKVNDGERP